MDLCCVVSDQAAAGAATRSWQEEGGPGGLEDWGALTSSRRQLSVKEILLGQRPRTLCCRPIQCGERDSKEPAPAQTARSLRGHRLPALGGFLRARRGEASSELTVQITARAANTHASFPSPSRATHVRAGGKRQAGVRVAWRPSPQLCCRGSGC